MSQLRVDKNKLTVVYKLLNDLLFLLIAFFALSLVAEGLVPGIVSSHISLLRITVLLFLNIAAIHVAGNFSGIDIPKQKISKKNASFIAILASLLIFNSLFKLNLILAIFILFLIATSGYLIYKNIFD